MSDHLRDSLCYVIIRVHVMYIHGVPLYHSELYSADCNPFDHLRRSLCYVIFSVLYKWLLLGVNTQSRALLREGSPTILGLFYSQNTEVDVNAPKYIKSMHQYSIIVQDGLYR